MIGPVQHPPAYCSHCKWLFPATQLAIGQGGTIIVAADDTKIGCPKCGNYAELLRGTYQMFADRFDMIIDPGISLGARLAVIQLIRDVQEHKLSLSEAKAAAEKIDRRFGKIFDISDWTDVARATLFAGILGTVGALTVAVATVAAPFLSSPPTIIVQQPPFSEELLKRLMGSAADPSLALSREKIELTENQKGHGARSNKGAKARTKTGSRKKDGHRTR